MSACLLGLCTRFDGGCRQREQVMALAERFVLVPVCPEQLGGLPTPRPPAEIQGGDGFAVLEGRSSVVTPEGQDVTVAFVRGAREVLRAVRVVGACDAVLKARSPSCGTRETYDGSFTRSLREGPGVTAALLVQEGIRLFDEEDLGGL